MSQSEPRRVNPDDTEGQHRPNEPDAAGAERPWRNPRVLQTLYWVEEASQSEIADVLGCAPSTISYWMQKHDIEARYNRHRGVDGPVPLWTDREGHQQLSVRDGDGGTILSVHRAMAIAEWGIDAVAGMHVHHTNQQPFDNRIGNLELLTPSEHKARHYEEQDGGKPYRDEETLRAALAESRPPDLADEWGCSVTTIHDWRRKFGIEAPSERIEKVVSETHSVTPNEHRPLPADKCDEFRERVEAGEQIADLARTSPWGRSTLHRHVSGNCSHGDEGEWEATCPKCGEATHRLPMHIRACGGDTK